MNGYDGDSRTRPFHLNPDPRYFYCGPTHGKVLSDLLGSVGAQAAPIILTGQSGTGKTALLHKALLKLPPETYTVFLRYTTLTADDLIHTLADELGIAAEQAAGDEVLARIRATLQSIAADEPAPLVIVDEAQNLCETGLRTLCELTWDGLINLVLVGHKRLCERIEMLQTGGRAVFPPVVLELVDLAMTESSNLVRYRLQVAGEDPGAVFPVAALKLIYNRTLGNPRRINVLCERALKLLKPGFTPDECMQMLRIAADSLEEEVPLRPIQAPGDNPATRQAAASGRGAGEAPSTPASRGPRGTDGKPAPPLPAGSQTGSSRRYTAVALGAMLILIALTSWLIDAQFAHEGTVAPEPSAELVELRSEMARLNEVLAETTAKQGALLAEMQELRSENSALRDELDRSLGKDLASGEWHAPVIADFAALETALVTSSDTGLAEYRVQQGDTLSAIARRHELSLAQIASWNGLDPQGRLLVGQRLVLTPREELKYTVRRGDTLTGLKRRFDVTLDELRRWNELPTDGRLYAGQRMRILVSLPAES